MVSPADLGAYQRMRARGLHPRNIEGSALLEQGASRDLLTYGHLLTPDQIEEAKEAMGLAQETEWPLLRQS